jgi:AcrR family transcriptional regulator
MLSAAARAFAEKGLAGTKLKDDILAPAGIAPGSFYYQFDDKVDLLLAVLEEYSTQYRDRLRQVHRASPGRLLEDICRDSYALLFELAESSTDVLRIQLKERHSDEPRVREYIQADRVRWLDHLAQDLERLASASGVRLDCDDAAELVVALSAGALSRYLETEDAERPAVRDRLLRNLVLFTIGGFEALASATHSPAHHTTSEAASK